MKIFSKAIISLFLITIILTSCNSFPPVIKTQPTQAMETALAIAGTAIAETQTAIPTVTPTATLSPSATSLPTTTPLPPSGTPTPIKTSIPVSGTPTIIPLENGLIWTECIVPSFDYGRNGPGPGDGDNDPDMLFANTCLNLKRPHSDYYDIILNGQSLRLKGECEGNLRLVIGKDVYQTSYISEIKNSCYSYDYTLLKNGTPIATVNGVKSITTDANRSLRNFGGKSVWEIYSSPPDENLSAIIIDGVNLNEKFQLEGSFFVYYLKNKLIFIVRKDGKYRVVYNEKFIGPEFDQIFMSHCCSSTTVLYGHGQYRFWGRIEGTYYVVAIH